LKKVLKTKLREQALKEKRKIPHRIRKYSFFNRLEAFNSEKVRHRDRLLQEQVEKYLKDYEYRLSHENHLDKPNPVKLFTKKRNIN